MDTFEPLTLRQLLDEAPKKFGDRAFIKYIRDEKIIEKSFSTVRSDSLAFCRFLRDIYGDKKSHIMIISKSTYEYIISLTGIIISGNVAIPVAPDSDAENVSAIIKAADVDCILYENEFSDRIEQSVEGFENIKTINLGNTDDYQALLDKYSDTSEYASLSDYETDVDECSLIIFTSGTTGERKGVMLSQKAIVGNTMFKPYSDIVQRTDVILSVLPLYHIFCFVSDYIGPMRHGNTLCLNGSVRDLFKNLQIFKPHQMRVVPMIVQTLLARINAVQAKNPDMSPVDAAKSVTGGNLDMMLAGGAYLDPALCREFDKYGIFLRQGYGMSEAGCKITVPDFDSDAASVGRVMNICDVRIQNSEIQVNTPCRMIGYYKKPELTSEMFTEDGWLKTGDIGFVTEDRQLFITGRVKNLIILSNGENVSPEGIEKKYKENLLVNEVLVYAEKDMIIAEVYPDASFAEKTGITDIEAELDKLTDKINETALPSHTVSKLIVRTEPLPKTATGKIIRK